MNPNSVRMGAWPKYRPPTLMERVDKAIEAAEKTLAELVNIKFTIINSRP